MGVVDTFGQSHLHENGKKNTLNIIKKSGGLSHPDHGMVKSKPFGVLVDSPFQ